VWISKRAAPLPAGYQHCVGPGPTSTGNRGHQDFRGGEDTACTSIVVAAELRYGAEKSGSPKLRDRIDLILSALDVLPLEPPADRYYGEVRQQLSRQGTPIGPNGLLIAAHALALDLTVVTADAREFARVPRLRIENWLSE
jgi:tRNA(fMet)-specific endonuclease VapC